MGLDLRKKSGNLNNGSRMVVSGQQTTGQKVFSNTFNLKTNPYNKTIKK
jgi:hypothetical protein